MAVTFGSRKVRITQSFGEHGTIGLSNPGVVKVDRSLVRANGPWASNSATTPLRTLFFALPSRIFASFSYSPVLYCVECVISRPNQRDECGGEYSRL